VALSGECQQKQVIKYENKHRRCYIWIRAECCEKTNESAKMKPLQSSRKNKLAARPNGTPSPQTEDTEGFTDGRYKIVKYFMPLLFYACKSESKPQADRHFSSVLVFALLENTENRKVHIGK